MRYLIQVITPGNREIQAKIVNLYVDSPWEIQPLINSLSLSENDRIEVYNTYLRMHEDIRYEKASK